MMKKGMRNKLLIALTSLVSLILLFSIRVNAGSIWKYTWNNTAIIIPVGESFDQYKDLPQATLYRDNEALTIANITYNTEGDWLYYSKNVDTSKIGVYKVWYKAYESRFIPGTCTGYKCLITFTVKDLEKPTLDIINPIVNLKRGTEIDLSTNIRCNDNYTKEVRIDFSGDVKTDTIGTYHIIVKATDESNNVTTGEFDVNVYDDVKPSIECLKEGGDIYIPLNGEYDIKSLFKAYDPYDGDITNKIVFPSVRTNKIEEYDYTVSVTNSIGSTSTFNAKIHVVDREEPKIVLSQKKLILDYKDNIEGIDFTTYIKNITDNNQIDYNNLTITNNIENKVGTYNVWFEYNDGYYIAKETMDISVISHEAPDIEVNDIILNIDSQTDLSKYVRIIDQSDPNIKSSLVIDDSEVEYDKEGTYYVNIYCMNSSGLSSEKRARVVVRKESTYTEGYKGYSITSIALGAMVVFLIIFNISYIIFSRKRNITKDNSNNIT